MRTNSSIHKDMKVCKRKGLDFHSFLHAHTLPKPKGHYPPKLH